MTNSTVVGRLHFGSLLLLMLLVACSGSNPSFTGRPNSTALSHSAFVEPTFSYRLVHNFGRGTDGVMPMARLVTWNGKLFGTTQYGGHGGNGTVFRVGGGGGELVVHDFGRSPDGARPVAGFANVNGKLYGTTEGGGKYKLGTVFQIVVNASGRYTETVIHSFGSANDGADPTGDLVAIKQGQSTELFGTTMAGGANYGRGTVFKISTDSSNAEKVIHSFGRASDGAYPEAGLIVLHNVLYGTTSAGGGPSNGNYGTVFKITTSGTESVLHAFACTDGMSPVASLTVLGKALYGTTEKGGNSVCTAGYGTVFSIDSGGSLRTVYAFGATPDGETPEASLALSRGTFYSTTYAGGTNGAGTIFSVTPGAKK